MNIKNIIKNIKWNEIHERDRSPFFHQIFLPNMDLRKDIPFDNRLKNFGSFLSHVAVDQDELSTFSENATAYFKKHINFLKYPHTILYQNES